MIEVKQNLRRWLPFFLALVGCVAMATLVSRYNSGVRWHYQLDRETAITRARAAAARTGIDAAGWLPRVTASYNGQTDFYLSHRPQRAETRLLTPVKTSVMLVEPTQRKRSYSVDLTNEGEVVAYEIRDSAAPAGTQTPADADAEASRRAAQTALEGLVGADVATEFRLVSEVKEKSNGTSYTWERALPPEADLKLGVTCLVRGGSVRKIEPSSSFAPRFLDAFDEGRSAFKAIELFTVSFILLMPLATLAFCLLGWARRELEWRTVFTFFGAVYLLGLLLSVFNGGLDELLMSLNGEGENKAAMTFGLVVNFLIVPFFYALGVVLVWGAGRVYARRARTPEVASFSALLRGRLFSRGVARPVAAGIMFGLFLCAIPYLVAASGLFGHPQLEGPLISSLTSRAPAVVSLIRPIDYGMLVLYGFLVPLALFYTHAPRLVRPLALAFGCLLMLTDSVYRSSAWGAFLIAALLIIAVEQIVRRYDLLTLVVALLASDAARAAWSLVIMPSTSLRASGLRAFAGLGALLAGALVLSWKGAGASELADEADAQPASEGAERDRLRAEFSVAHEAQQRMLPTNPPRVTGYEISAMCRPAREVGGDLYDFLSLPNERIGFVVADVSGKGVPAALYMTLTKGLLASVAETESDPARILREVNRHLYEVCRRKVFVTMILGVLDAPTRTLTYARAGHNPGIWHSARSQTATWLRAHGLGLGLNRGALFDKSLQLESIKVESGDSLVFYSDGITEAMNAAGEEYGEERLLAAVARADGLSAEQTQNAIVEDVVQFLDGGSPQDDMTLVVLRVAQD